MYFLFLSYISFLIYLNQHLKIEKTVKLDCGDGYTILWLSFVKILKVDGLYILWIRFSKAITNLYFLFLLKNPNYLAILDLHSRISRDQASEQQPSSCCFRCNMNSLIQPSYSTSPTKLLSLRFPSVASNSQFKAVLPWFLQLRREEAVTLKNSLWKIESLGFDQQRLSSLSSLINSSSREYLKQWEAEAFLSPGSVACPFTTHNWPLNRMLWARWLDSE